MSTAIRAFYLSNTTTPKTCHRPVAGGSGPLGGPSASGTGTGTHTGTGTRTGAPSNRDTR
jgi:hypothetical protein